MLADKTFQPSKNSGRDRGWYKASNLMTDKWARILGPQSFLVYHVIKSMCISNSTITSPQASQRDWGEWCGLGTQVFKRALKRLVDAGIVDKISPGNPTHAMQYEVRDLDTVSMDVTLLESVAPLSEGNRFHDPLFEPDAWEQNMYREAKTPRIRRVARCRLNGVQLERRVTGNSTRRVTGNSTIVRLRDSKTEEILSLESIRGPNGPHQFFLNNTSSENTGWIIISSQPKDYLGGIDTQENSSTMINLIKKRTTPQMLDAARQAKLLPIREEMPQSMQVWYDLPLVSKPKTPRVYKRNLSYLSKLSQGQFPTDYQNLNADWTHQKGQPEITRKHLDYCWSDQEIAHLLDTKFRQILTDASYWPQNKEKYFKGLSFEFFLFNRYAGRSWLLDLAYRQPQLDKSIRTRQAIEQDVYPDCTHEIAEALEISQKLRPDEYAGIAQNFSRIIQFLQLLPPNEERGGVFKFVCHPKTAAYSLAGFLRQEYGWIKDPGAGLISLSGKPVRRWLEEWNDQEIRWSGQTRAYRLLDLLNEYNRHGQLRMALESIAKPIVMDKEQEGILIEDDKESEVQRQRRLDVARIHLAPEEIIHPDGHQPEKGAMWHRLKAALQRLKQLPQDLVVDESYAGF